MVEASIIVAAGRCVHTDEGTWTMCMCIEWFVIESRCVSTVIEDWFRCWYDADIGEAQRMPICVIDIDAASWSRWLQWRAMHDWCVVMVDSGWWHITPFASRLNGMYGGQIRRMAVTKCYRLIRRRMRILSVLRIWRIISWLMIWTNVLIVVVMVGIMQVVRTVHGIMMVDYLGWCDLFLIRVHWLTLHNSTESGVRSGSIMHGTTISIGIDHTIGTLHTITVACLLVTFYIAGAIIVYRVGKSRFAYRRCMDNFRRLKRWCHWPLLRLTVHRRLQQGQTPITDHRERYEKLKARKNAN